MEVYSEPLQAFYRASRFRRRGDPDDVVHGFFASRLERPDYLRRWQSHGGLLRRWLANGLCFYLRERDRDSRRSQVEEPPAELFSTEPEPWTALDASFASSLVHRALAMAAATCRAEGLAAHWEAFVRHHYEKQGYREIALELGVSPGRAAVQARAALRRFREAVYELLLRDGVPPERLHSALDDLLGGGEHAESLG